MVTRNRQREHENEKHYSTVRYTDWFPVMIAPLTGQQIEPPAPRLKPKSEAKPAVRNVRLLYKGHRPVKVTRAQKDTKQRAMKPGNRWHWGVLFLNSEDQRILKREFAFFNQPLNYHWGNLWGIRHCEIEYEGESDPL